MYRSGEYTCEEIIIFVGFLSRDRRQVRHFLDADCLEVGETQGSSKRLVGKYPVKPVHLEGLK